MTSAAHPISTLNKLQTVILLRWVLIIATAYLVLFSRPLQQTPPGVVLFVALYVASNLIFARLSSPLSVASVPDGAVVVFDVVAVCVGLALSGGTSSDFFVVYFVVLFLSAFTERLGFVVGAALLISAAHLYTVSRFVRVDDLLTYAYTLRIPFLFSVALFFGNLVGNARSREREAEEARARELRMEFLSTVSHDVKNPLSVIQSLATLLLDGDAGPLNAAQTDLIHRIRASVRHVVTLSLNIIDVARIEAGRLALQRTKTNLAEVVEDALVLARSAGALKGITLCCAVDPDLPVLHVDVVQIERVISNLLDNAVKYTPTGGAVSLSVSGAADGVALVVRDNGPGIAAEEIPTVFERYRRQTAGSRIVGSGLGLFIVKAIVEAHGGSIQISSVVGQGTTVTVHLPIVQPSSPSSGCELPSPKRRWWRSLRMHLAAPSA
jgi:signal transduction histidine kinase